MDAVLDQADTDLRFIERVWRIVTSVLAYVGIPIIAQAIDPIISVSSANHLSYAITHMQTVATHLSSANYVVPYTLNAMVMLLWLVWIWAILSSIVAISYRALGKEMSPRVHRATKLGAVLVFVAWQGLAGHSASVQHSASANASQTQTPQTQLVVNATPAHTVTVTPGADLWDLETAANPGVSNSEVANLVDEAAALNHLSNPSLLFPGEEVIIATETAVPSTTTPIASIPLSSPQTPVSPATSISLDAPTTGAPAINLDAVHVGGGQQITDSVGSHTQSNAVEEAIMAAFLLSAAAFGFRQLQRSKFVRRPKGKIAPVSEGIQRLILEQDKVAPLYNDMRNAIRLITALGTPRIEAVYVSDTTIEIQIAGTTRHMQNLEEIEVLDDKTVGVSRPVPSVMLDDVAPPYGALLYVGMEADGEHLFINTSGQGVIGLENAPSDLWNALFTQYTWLEWLRYTQPAWYSPSETIDITRLQGAIDGFEFNLTTEDELLNLVVGQFQDVSRMQAEGIVGSVVAGRVDAGVYMTHAIFAKEQLSDSTLNTLETIVGKSDLMAIFVNQQAGTRWIYDDGVLTITDNKGDSRHVKAVTMPESSLIEQVAYIVEQMDMYVDNPLTVKVLNRPGLVDAPYIRLCAPTPYVVGAEHMSPLATRITTVLATSQEPYRERELAMTLLPGLTETSKAFQEALGEIKNVFGSLLIDTPDGLILSSDIGTDIGRVINAKNINNVRELLQAVPFGDLVGVWPYAYMYSEMISATLIDLLVNTGVQQTKKGVVRTAEVLYGMLTELFGHTDRIEYLKTAIVLATQGSDSAFKYWLNWSKPQKSLGDMHSPGDTDILEEVNDLIGTSK